MAEAAAFYQEQVQGLGWTLQGEPAITDTTAYLSFTQGDQEISVIITTDAGLTTVNIVMAQAQE